MGKEGLCEPRGHPETAGPAAYGVDAMGIFPLRLLGLPKEQFTSGLAPCHCVIYYQCFIWDVGWAERTSPFIDRRTPSITQEGKDPHYGARAHA